MASGGTRSGRRRHHTVHSRYSDFTFPHIQTPAYGSYDPGLLSQIHQSQRGLLDLLQDTHRSNVRARQDTRIGRRQTRRGAQRALGDIRFERQGTRINFTQDLQDLAQAEQRGTQDYETALSNLGRKYENLASSQGQTANARGVYDRGTLAASAAARAQNYAVERQPLDTSQSRLLEDIGTKRSREQSAFERQMGRYHTYAHRTRQDLHSQLRELHRNLRRTLGDSRLQRSRAIREQGIYALDQAQQAYYQAHSQDPTIHFPSRNRLRR